MRSSIGKDQLYEKIKGDIDWQLFQLAPAHYTHCPLCSMTISDTNKPVLLECKHILCSYCIDGEQYCANCQREKVKIKAQPYMPLLKYLASLQEGDDNAKYSFTVTHLHKSSSKLIKDIPSNETWQNLLKQAPDFMAFLRQCKGGTQLTIARRYSYLYQTIKDKTVNDLCREKRIVLKPSSTGQVNLITFFDRNLGGQHI